VCNIREGEKGPQDKPFDQNGARVRREGNFGKGIVRDRGWQRRNWGVVYKALAPWDGIQGGGRPISFGKERDWPEEGIRETRQRRVQNGPS